MSTEVMTAQEAFDVYVTRKVDEREVQAARVSLWAKCWGERAPHEHRPPPRPPDPKPLDRDVEIRAIQLGID